MVRRSPNSPAGSCGRVPRACSRRSRAAGRRARRRGPWRGQYRPADPRRCRAVTEALRFWALIELIGLGAAPLAGVLLARLPGAGLGLGKVLGLLLVTWLVWLGGTSTLVPYGDGQRRAVDRARLRARAARLGARLGGAPRGRARGAARLARAAALAAAGRAGAGARPAARGGCSGAPRPCSSSRSRGWRCSSPTRPTCGTPRSRWTWRSSTRPTARTRSRPQDPWLAGADLNYYYLGHLAMAMLGAGSRGRARRGLQPRRRRAVRARRGGGVHRSAATLWARGRAASAARSAPGWSRVALVLVLGQPRGRARAAAPTAGRCATTTGSRRRASIPDTITEFPWFSFLLGDLHAHVLALPFTLLALAFALQVALAGPRVAGRGARAARGVRRGARRRLPLRGQLVVLSGAWPGCSRSPWSPGCATRAASPTRPAAVRWLLAVLARQRAARAAVPPHVRPGRARDRARRRGARLRRLAARRSCSLFGSLAVFVALAYVGRLLAHAPAAAQRGLDRGRRRVRRLAARGGRATRTSRCSRCCSRVALRALLAARTRAAERLVWLLVAGGVACVLGPELLYVRDEFDDSALYRMNTVFKLDYQAWLLLGLAGDRRARAGGATWLPRAGGALAVRGRRRRSCWPPRPSTRSPAPTRARTASTRAPTLDGLGWLRDRAPGDVGAIAWLERPRAGRRRRARGGGRGLLGLRPRAHLDVHRAADGARLARPRAPVGPRRRRRAPSDVARAYAARPRPRGAAGAATATACATSSSARSSAPTTATRASAKWDELGRRVYDADGTIVWELVRRGRR